MSHKGKIEIPQHIAIVMDGNGRWAKERGLPRTAGHEAGEKVLFDLVEAAISFGVKELSAYAFSTENWKRTPEEVKFLMGYSRDVLRNRRDRLNEMGVKVQWIGRPQRLWKSVIEELEEAQELTKKNKVLTLNMCVNYGGGGIPVIERDKYLVLGREAVIDKDRASALLATGLGADLFVISTDAEKVFVDFKKPTQRGIDKITADELQKHYDEGQFPAGSMGPKVQSAIRYLRNGGKEVIITSYEFLIDALDGKAGTHIVP